MKRITIFLLIVLFTFATVINVNAQAAESIWLTTSGNSYKTGENLTVTLNAVSGTPIQGFTFQIRYDPNCLRPVNASSPLPGMNGLPLPQISGVADGSYASVSPLTVNGVLAEVHFVTLKGCQTNLTLESAALAVRSPEGFAAPLAGVSVNKENIALKIDKEVVEAQPIEQTGSMLILNPPAVTNKGLSSWWLLLGAVLLVGVSFVAYRYFQTKKGATSTSTSNKRPSYHMAALHIKHGPHAGESFVLKKSSCLIGSDPSSDICINGPHIINQHAKIVSTNTGYYLMNLGGETFINGQAVRKNSAALKSGDVVRLGKSALFVFG